MATARELRKDAVITMDGAHWIVEDCHIQQTGKQRPAVYLKLRNMLTGHGTERSFDESHHFDEPDVQSKAHQYLYHDKSGYVFMDSATFDQITLPPELIGDKTWLLQEGAEFPIQFVEGAVVQIDFPESFVDEVVETAEPSTAVHGSNVMKEAQLACGLTIKVPLFIKLGESVKVDTATHKYLGKESGN